MLTPRPRHPAPPGFTLVELLVAMTVLLLLVGVLTQMLGSVAAGVRLGTRRVDADAQARLVLDRLAADLAAMLRRPDVDYRFERRAGDDFLSFYSEAPAAPPAAGGAATAADAPRSVALVGFQVGASAGATDFPGLQRAAVDVTGAGMTFAPPRGGAYVPALQTPGTLPAVAPADFRVLGETVFRFEFAFVYRDPNTGKTTLKATLPAGAAFTDLQALAVAVAVLDDRSRVILTPTQLTNLHDVLRDYADADAVANRDVAAVWAGVLDGRDAASPFPPPGVPPAAAGAVRVYQRYFPLR